MVTPFLGRNNKKFYEAEFPFGDQLPYNVKNF